MTSFDPIVICSYARTPIGGFQGALSSIKATELGAVAVRAALERAELAPGKVEQIIMGCVLPAGLGQAPARQTALRAGLPLSVGATTVNKMCGSGLQAAVMAHDALKAGSADIIVAGGMESMSNAPYLMAKHRGGARIGHDVISDSMYLDGLEDAYERLLRRHGPRISIHPKSAGRIRGGQPDERQASRRKRRLRPRNHASANYNASRD
jgi:acetyl-CoA C-acetyltransferase